MRAQLRTIERAEQRPRRMPRGLMLLTAAESKLREGNVRDALELFRGIVDRCPPSLERLAATSYLATLAG
jgi:hypothetical protein